MGNNDFDFNRQSQLAYVQPNPQISRRLAKIMAEIDLRFRAENNGGQLDVDAAGMTMKAVKALVTGHFLGKEQGIAEGKGWLEQALHTHFSDNQIIAELVEAANTLAANPFEVSDIEPRFPRQAQLEYMQTNPQISRRLAKIMAEIDLRFRAENNGEQLDVDAAAGTMRAVKALVTGHFLGQEQGIVEGKAWLEQALHTHFSDQQTIAGLVEGANTLASEPFEITEISDIGRKTR